MPSREEIQWSQLKVGGLVLAALAVLTGLIFLMTGSSGGIFAHKITLRAYFSGCRRGKRWRSSDARRGHHWQRDTDACRSRSESQSSRSGHAGGERYRLDLHTDSTASITQAGVLGDSYVNIDSTHAFGPPPLNNAELQSGGAPSIQDVISSSQVSIEEINRLMHKIERLVDTLNTKQGTVGELLNDPELARKVVHVAADLETISANLSAGKGSAGKFLSDESMYNHLNSAAGHLDNVATTLDEGKGSLGKLLKDETFTNNLNSAVTNANQLMAQINSGKGAMGEMIKDPAVAKKLDDTITNLDSLLKGINEGQGTAGQLVKNRALYDHLDQTADQAQQLIKGMREDPKKYLVIQLKVF